MFKSRVKCHSTENFTWASNLILWKTTKGFNGVCVCICASVLLLMCALCWPCLCAWVADWWRPHRCWRKAPGCGAGKKAPHCVDGVEVFLRSTGPTRSRPHSEKRNNTFRPDARNETRVLFIRYVVFKICDGRKPLGFAKILARKWKCSLFVSTFLKICISDNGWRPKWQDRY